MSKGRNLAKLAVSNTGGIQVSALSTVVGAAPAALDTFNELAAALGNDANFATTVNNAIAAKQATLVSGTNIKTVNSTSLLGSGNIAVQPTLVSGTNIRTINGNSLLGNGDLSLQTTLLSGTNIKTINGTSLLGSGDIAITGGASAATNGTLGTVYGLTQTTVVNGGNPYGNTILGYGAYATTNNQNTRYNVVVGVNSYANWYDSVVLGYNTKGEGTQTITIGTSARNQADYSVSIGTNSGVGLSSGQSVVVGSSASVSDYTGSSTVLGYYAKSYASQGIAVGHYAESRGSSSVAIGKSAYAQGTNSVALGLSNYAYGSNSIIIGSNTDDAYNSAIVLNATSNPMSANGNGFYVSPIQNASTSDVLYYNTTTKQITYGAAPGGGSSISQLAQLSDVSISSPTPGQVLTFQNGLWRNVTPAASSGGASGGGAALRTNGFGLAGITSGNTFDVTSSSEGSALIAAWQAAQTPLTNFSNQTGQMSMMIFTAAQNGSYYSMPPEWSPGAIIPAISQTGSTSFSIQTSGMFQSMPLSNFPQYSDNEGRCWFTINFGQFQYSSITHNAQYSGPTSAKIFLGAYNGAGFDPTQNAVTTISTLKTADTGSQNVVIRVSGYNAIIGQNTTIMFMGCTNITFSGSELAFSYTTSQDYGNAPYTALMFGIDIQ